MTNKCKICGKKLQNDSVDGIGPECLKKVRNRKEQIDLLAETSVFVQTNIKNAIPTGGAIAAFYANHRLSFDIDHLLLNMTEEVDEIRNDLRQINGWEYSKNQDVCILGKLNGIEVGFRQMFRNKPIETITVKTKNGDWIIPTIQEITGFKAILTAKRNKVRDYLDFAALATKIGDDEAVLNILKNLNDGFKEDWVYSVSESLSTCLPDDLDELDVKRYKGVTEEWSDWNKTVTICKKYGKMMVQELNKK